MTDARPVFVRGARIPQYTIAVVGASGSRRTVEGDATNLDVAVGFGIVSDTDPYPGSTQDSKISNPSPSLR